MEFQNDLISETIYLQITTRSGGVLCLLFAIEKGRKVNSFWNLKRFCNKRIFFILLQTLHKMSKNGECHFPALPPIRSSNPNSGIVRSNPGSANQVFGYSHKPTISSTLCSPCFPSNIAGQVHASPPVTSRSSVCRLLL